MKVQSRISDQQKNSLYLYSMVTTYRLNVNELSMELLNSIKALFKDKDIEITVSEPMDETEYLLESPANSEHLRKAIESIADGKGIQMSLDELQKKFGS